MASVELEHIRKVYDNGHTAVHDASFHVADGEFVVLVGPSGCGKTTLLRMIAGLEDVTDGRLTIGDRVVNDLPPAERDVAMVFQNYALYPHMSVYDNMAFGLRRRKLPKDEVDRRVREAAKTLDIEAVLDRRPKELSGGQRQRVAVGRAIVRQPAVFLFDEPLSNLDAKLRTQTRAELTKLHRRLEATMIYVTHDQVEALTMGDRIVVVEGGLIQQVDTPMGVYHRPANRFVAGFIGSPAMNFFEGTLERGDGEGLVFRADDGAFTLALGAEVSAQAAGHLGRAVALGVRPEAVGVAATAATSGMAEGAAWEGVGTWEMEVVEAMGSEVVFHARKGEAVVVARVGPQRLPAAGATVELAFDAGRVHLFDGATGDAVASGAAVDALAEVL
ncbi:MAG TPA: sn-glycerol-3-phosphate ABC transporter ATP-binding protein UgpC [Rhodothermales bacterium]|nr:sn-glycerol-3-phosphate ABC transporter ATP-binding protein UgpC [Rhodothermales bacterium]